MRLLFLICFFICSLAHISVAQSTQAAYKNLTYQQLVNDFKNPPESAKPWVFWYWMQASVSREGITADLEAMKYAGIGGAYLMPIKDTANPPLMKSSIRQLTPEWWAMMKFAFEEADRLGLKMAMHVSDGFALAGGPWITPALSMQKVVWSRIHVNGNTTYNDTLPKPPTSEGYYKDIAVYAYPTPTGEDVSTQTIKPIVTTSNGVVANFLTDKNNKQNFSSADSCWIQYAFEKPFTCRSVIIRTNGNNYQAHRLKMEVSDDGLVFKSVGRMKAPRHGWQDTDEDVTHAIESVTAKYFRFVYNVEGSEPGAEDLDAAKWKQTLKIKSIELSGASSINQYEGKNGSIWRLSERTAAKQVNDSACIPLNKLINITKFLEADGRLKWEVPAGKWTIIRMGHTSTGHTNATGGGGKGLECDKFNPEAIKLQFDNWFGEAIKQAGPVLAKKVLSTFHIDSWECGSQNWSPVFREEFMKRRGYDLIDYLPIMAGVSVESVEVSENFLHDIRQTISELVADVFYKTMAKLSKEKGCTFTAESVAPTMMSDGMMHYKNVDIPMGEFWLRSPTHDKPNDMMDAISGAHIYGKPIVQAEAFTELRMAWDEYPAMLKTLQDRNYALGINKLVYHVFTHNPWLNKKPGMTLDGVGLYFQRDQTWWKPGKAWVSYAQRCQALLQAGRPVVDIAVFTGEELPRRSTLPDRLVSALPGIFGEAILKREKARLANKNEPLAESPVGVRHSANIADPADWIDPLHGYTYDSFNPDVLLTARVLNHEVVFESGAKYKLLILPQPNAMLSSNDVMSLAVANKLCQLVKDGATIITNQEPVLSTAVLNTKSVDTLLRTMVEKIWHAPLVKKAVSNGRNLSVMQLGAGRIIQGPYTENSFDALGITKDLIVKDSNGSPANNIAWTHRETEGVDIYFISNQTNNNRRMELSLRVSGRVPEFWNAVTGTIEIAKEWKMENGRTTFPVRLAANGSVFVVLATSTKIKTSNAGTNWANTKVIKTLNSAWQVEFDSSVGGPSKSVEFTTLSDWSEHTDSAIKYYSGTAIYTQSFHWNNDSRSSQILLDLGNVSNIASVTLNGVDCGIVWTAPFVTDITKSLKKDQNKLVIKVTNTWANRLIGDQRLREENRITHTTAPIRIANNPLLSSGLLGPVTLRIKQ